MDSKKKKTLERKLNKNKGNREQTSNFVRYSYLPDGLSYSYDQGLQISAEDKETILTISPPDSASSQELMRNYTSNEWYILPPFRYLEYPVQYDHSEKDKFSEGNIDLYSNIECPYLLFILDRVSYTATLYKSIEPESEIHAPLYKNSVISYIGEIYILTKVTDFALYNEDTTTSSKLYIDELPSTVQYIGNYTFYNANIKIKEITSDTYSIGVRAFSYANIHTNDQDSLTLPHTLRNLEENAFSYSNIRNVIVDMNLRETMEKYASVLFRGCTLLKTVVWNSSNPIQKETFYGCSSLHSVDINVSSIGDNAFYECSSIESITIKRRGKGKIGDNAFGQCTSLAEVIVYPDMESVGSRILYDTSHTPTSTNDVVYTTIKFRGYVSNISDEAFKSHVEGHFVRNIYFDGGVDYFSYTMVDTEPQTPTGEYGSYVKRIRFRNEVGSLGDYLFSCEEYGRFHHLESLSLQWDSIGSIGPHAFYRRYDISPSTLNLHGISSIGENAFQECSIDGGSGTVKGLIIVHIYAKNNSCFIGKQAFKDCTQLRYVYFGDTMVVRAQQNIFSGCSKCIVHMREELRDFLLRNGIITESGNTYRWDDATVDTINPFPPTPHKLEQPSEGYAWR